MSKPMVRIPVVLISVFCAAAVFIVSTIGKQSRVPPSDESVPVGAARAAIVKKTSDVYFLWKKSGYTGNILVHFGNYLHFIPVDSPLLSTYRLPSPAALIRQMEAYENALTYRNYLWVAMQGNMVRYIYSVLPRETYQKKRREISEGREKDPFVERTVLQRDDIEDAELGLLRTLSDSMPMITEPVLVNIDASYLSTADFKSFADVLKRSGLRIRLLTFCLSEDSPDVSESDRERLRQFALTLAAEHFVPYTAGGIDLL